jgi:tRNA threonylcarbamoyladenosine biosynthesis protein TsaB
MQLAIDTSTQSVSIALSSGGEVLAEHKWHSRKNHTVELLPNIVRFLDQNTADLHSIDGIAVAKGPGSFNGLRVGISIAKGLSISLGLPLLGISTLEAEAFAHADSPLPLCPIHNAGRQEIATARYQMRAGIWYRLTEEHITTVKKLCSKTERDTIFCGEISPSIEAELKRELGEQVSISHIIDRICRASLVAKLGWQRLSKGDSDDLVSLQPLYLRRPPITKPKQEKHIFILQDMVDDS